MCQFQAQGHGSKRGGCAFTKQAWFNNSYMESDEERARGPGAEGR